MRAGVSGDTVGFASSKLLILEPQKKQKENNDLHKRFCWFGCEVTLKTRNHSHIRARDEALDFRHAQTKYIQ